MSERERLWSEDKRFKVVCAGRRSGKTELAKRMMVKSLLVHKAWKDPRYFIAAPTRVQAKRIYWDDIKALVPKRYIKKIYETDLRIVSVYKSELWVMGLDKPQRIEGVSWDGCILDEYADMRPGAWMENVRPALADRKGWCWFVGVPNGLNHFKDLADYASSGSDPEWGFYTWPSSCVLDKGELESLKRTLDERTFRQEFEASFEAATGRVYYAYSRGTHEDKSIEIDKKRPIVICADFNVDPCVWVLCQSDGKRVWAFDEVVLKDTNTVEMGQEVLKRYGNHGKGFLVTGDAAGSARSTVGKSDYALLTGLGFNAQRVKKSNPYVKDRVNAVNALLKSASGEVRFTHHPRCMYLRKDFETVSWREGGLEIDKRDRERTHASDAIGYFIADEFQLKAARNDSGIRFYK